MNDKLNEKNLPFDLDLENIKQDTITTKIPQRNKSKKQTEIIPNIEDPNEANKEQVLYKCPNCSRKFKREAYAKHVPICARVFQSKKEDEAKKKDIKEIKGLNDKKGNKSKWENQSNELRAMIHNKRAEKDKNNNNKEKEKEKKNEKKGFIKRPKWENQSDELRAIIQQKRAEKAEDGHKKKELKIEIEEDKRHTTTKLVITQNSPKEGFTRDGIYYQCDLCNKKFTKINYESHLFECKQKHKEKKNITFNNRTNIGLINNPKSPSTRQPTMPAVNYGGYSKKPNFNLKFGKH